MQFTDLPEDQGCLLSEVFIIFEDVVVYIWKDADKVP